MMCPICGLEHEPPYKVRGIRYGSPVWVVYSPCMAPEESYVLPEETLDQIAEEPHDAYEAE